MMKLGVENDIALLNYLFRHPESDRQKNKSLLCYPA